MNFKDVAIQYIENGLCTLPAIRSQKRPMCKWTKYQNELPTATEWEGWQIADALCIVCGKVSGNLLMIDFDQQGKALPDFKSKIDPELYRRLVIEQSQSGGFHIIVRSEAPVPSNTVLAKDPDGKVLIETRGEGGIFLCAPTPGYVLTQGNFQDIPVLGAETIETLLNAAWSLDQQTAEEDGSRGAPAPLASAANCRPQSAVSKGTGKTPMEDYNERGRGDFKRLLEKHGWRYTGDEADNERWLRPGKSEHSKEKSASLHHTMPTFYIHSSNCTLPANKGYSFFYVYAHLEHGGDQKAATKDLARQGYGDALTIEPVELTSFIADLPGEKNKEGEDDEDDDDEESEDDCSETFPAHLLNVPGFVSEFAQYVNSVSHVEQPTYSLAAALAFQALLCAQNVKDPTGIRTNPYIIVAGRSASGKDKGREIIKKVFTQLVNTPKTKLERHYKPLHHFIESVASYQALIKRLKRNHGVLLWLWDELGKELASWTKDRSANLSGVKTELMRLYSSADSIYVPHVKASSDPKDEEADSIQQPNLILYGTAEKETLFNAFSISELTDGLVGRLMIFEGNDYADRKQQSGQIPIPENILDVTDWWLEKRAKTINQEIPLPDIVPVTDEADEIFNQFYNVQKQLKYDRVKDTLWGRAQQQARQFALIYACSADKDNPVVDKNAAQWAYELVTYLIERKIHIADRHVADSEFDRQQKEVLRHIESCGGQCEQSTLTRKFQRLEKRRRDDIIINLKDTGTIREERRQKEGSQKYAVFYILIKKKKSSTG